MSAMPNNKGKGSKLHLTTQIHHFSILGNFSRRATAGRPYNGFVTSWVSSVSYIIWACYLYYPRHYFAKGNSHTRHQSISLPFNPHATRFACRGERRSPSIAMPNNREKGSKLHSSINIHHFSILGNLSRRATAGRPYNGFVTSGLVRLVT